MQYFKKIYVGLLDFLYSVSPIKFFISIAAASGLLIILITPPFQTPDEPVHFLRAYQITNFNFVVDAVPNKPAGGELPDSLGDMITLTTTQPSVQFMPGQKYDIRKTKHALSIRENQSDTENYDFSSTAIYSPVAYLPQATGILVARILRLPPIVMMYSARLANLLIWILLIGLVIHLIPRKKWAVVVAGLLPMAIFQAGSLSTDVMAVGSAMLFVVYILKLLDQKNDISNKQTCLIIVIASIALLSKQIMVVLVPLILLLPSKKLGGAKPAVIKKITAIFIPIGLLAVWSLLVKNIDITTTFVNNQNSAEQINFVLQNPHSFVNVLWNTHFFNWGDSITRSFIGTFGWMDAPLSEAIVIVGYITLFLALVVNSQATGKFKQWLTNKQKLVFLLVLLAYWGIVNAALYAVYSPVGFKIIVGLQGRYFLPMLLLLTPLVYGSWLKANQRAYKIIVTCLPLFLLLSSLLTIYYRYYINNV